MSDSEDDYMKFELVPDEKDVRPSLLVNRQRRQHEIYKKQLDSRLKRPKTVGELEKESRKAGLNTAISSDNKGFKMLERMGFKPGESLGKSQLGIKEPISIVVRQDGTSGVGREAHIEEKMTKARRKHVANLANCEKQFTQSKRELAILKLIRKDLFKAQKICEELDWRNKIAKPIKEFYWTRETIKKMRKQNKEKSEEVDEDCSESSDDDDDDEFEQFITEENLQEIIDYLRERHLYCLYCAITGSDDEDLQESCPGAYRDDHDDADLI